MGYIFYWFSRLCCSAITSVHFLSWKRDRQDSWARYPGAAMRCLLFLRSDHRLRIWVFISMQIWWFIRISILIRFVLPIFITVSFLSLCFLRTGRSSCWKCCAALPIFYCFRLAWLHWRQNMYLHLIAAWHYYFPIWECCFCFIIHLTTGRQEHLMLVRLTAIWEMWGTMIFL